MISIDTNVLLRYLCDDDPCQSEQATNIIENSDGVLITDIVLIETIWTLGGSKYKLNKDSIIEIIDYLIKKSYFYFDNDAVIWKALIDYKNAKLVKVGKKKKQADFPDVLIINKSKQIAEDREKEFKTFYSFDQALDGIDNVKVMYSNH